MALASAPTFASVHEETMTSIDRTTAQTPTAHHRRGQINSEAAVAEEQRRHEPQRPERDGDGLRQLWEVGSAKGLCSPQEVDQTVDDEQSGEGRHHACSRARRGAAPARRSASRLSSRRESRRIIAISARPTPNSDGSGHERSNPWQRRGFRWRKTDVVVDRIGPRPRNLDEAWLREGRELARRQRMERDVCLPGPGDRPDDHLSVSHFREHTPSERLRGGEQTPRLRTFSPVSR